MSNGEEIVQNLLIKSHLSFEREKTFNDLRGGRYRYDFCVQVRDKQVLIEVDGEQHFKFVSVFYRSQREWQAMLEHDRRKNSYALANNLPLFRIPYWELNNLKSVTDLFQKQFHVTSRWHNDELRAPKS